MPARLYPDRKRPLISAHRGFSSVAPENTMPALQAAYDAGADIAEIDVRMTADGALVLMHDAMLERTTNRQGLISAMTLAEIRTLDAGEWFGPGYAGTPVPTLDEVLAWSRGRIGLLVELKNSPERDPAFVDTVVATIEAHAVEGWAVPACFDHRTLAEIHQLRPEWPLEMIVPCRLADPVHAARAAGATLLSLEPDFTVAEDIEAMHAAGLSALTTVTSMPHGRRLIEIGVDILESSDVGLVVSTLRQCGHR